MPRNASEITNRITRLVLSRNEDWWFLDFDNLSPPDQVFLIIWELYSEVYNGGLWQYFINSSGQRVPYACDALKAIGARQLVPILEAAISSVGPDVPWNDDEARHRIIYNLPKPVRDCLHNLDRQFNAHIDGLNELLYYYLLKHRDQVEAPAEFWEGATVQ
jgi:hypothetical protein